MITATGRHVARKAIVSLTRRSQTLHSGRSFASSTAIADLMPEALKDAVKSSMIDEASRHDSKLWGDDSTSSAHNRNDSSTPNGHLNGTTGGNNITQVNGQHNSNDVNHPISPARLQMLHDPLDEWYLDTQPQSSKIHSIKLTNENDPFILSKHDMSTLSKDIRTDLIGTDHPVLAKAAAYFFEEGQDGGKKVRPMMVLLLSRAMAIDTPSIGSIQRSDLFTAQRRLAEISEMIHTASLFHDDVIDGADTRRGAPAVHKVFGNKMAILAGDYLLARASIFLARLRDVEVVETMSTIIEHLVRGEVMQMKGVNGQDLIEEKMIQYLRKNFYKTASLMANSCKSAAILGGYNDDIVSAAYRYGKHLGVAFQLVDDVLDFDGSASAMGKPALSDLNAGLSTAPVLFAAEMYPSELQPLMDRKFREEGDVETTVNFLRESNGIERTKQLAQVHAELAIDAVMELKESPYRDSLVHLAHRVVERSR